MMPPKSRTSTRARLLAASMAVRSDGLRRVCGRLRDAALGALWCAMASGCAAPPRAEGTVVMASGTDLESGNPVVTIHALSRQIQRHALFVTLVRFDGRLQPVPYLARAWSWDAGQRQLALRLSARVRWHDGIVTTAHDVKFTLDATRDVAVGSPRAGDLADVDSVIAQSDTLVTIYFRSAQSRVPNVLAELPIVPKHLLDSVPRTTWRASAFATAPVGNGPFRFLDRTAGRRWRFVRNDSFPAELGGPPALQQIVVAVVDEASTKFAGLVSGELDVAGVSPVMAFLVQRDPTLQLLTPPALLSNVLAFNTTRVPFDNAELRRAVTLSIDRQQLVEAAVAGYATPAGSAIPPGLPVSPARLPPFDTTRADQLFDAAGWRRGLDGKRGRDGTTLTIELLTVGSGDMAMEQLVQSALAARGVTVRIRVAEMATFLSTVRAPSKTFDMALTGIPGDIGLGQLSAMFMTAQRGGALDYTGFHRPALDAALVAARASAPANATQAWARVDSLLAAEAPVAWLYHARGVQGVSRRLENVTMDLRGELTTIAQWTRRGGS